MFAISEEGRLAPDAPPMSLDDLRESTKRVLGVEVPFEPPRGWTVLKSSRAGNVHFYLLAGDADDQSGVSGNV